MAGHQTNSVKGDRALSSGDKDRLGFRDVAKRIAISLVDRASENGLVIGVEGAWGSGKSSLLFLIDDELKKLPEDRKPSVINFRPWLIGNRDALITGLFSELSKQLDQVALDAGDATAVSVEKAKEAGKLLRHFVNALSKAGSVIEVAGSASGFVHLALLGRLFKASGEMTDKEAPAPQLSDLKDKLAKSLRDLGHRFIITVDDVDRLEPSEVIEILRLVRSVVDLPNIVYLLCYDIDILAQAIEKAAGVISGKSYLEKIVQLTVMVPQPEPLQLRQWFSDELHLIASVKTDDELARLKLVIDYEGGRQLRTPRSVVRALDAVRFFWPPLKEVGADLADLIWLQLIKDGNPILYRWIEEYCATASILSLGIARVEDAEKKHKLEALFAAVTGAHFDDITYRDSFAEQLPGFEVDYSKKERGFKLFEPVGERELKEVIRKRRLASPDHYRLYFALSAPSHALTQSDFTSMWAATQASAHEAAAILIKLLEEPAGVSLTKADLLLERIRGVVESTLNPVQCQNLLVAFSQIMDEVFRRHPFDDFWINSSWDRAQRLVPLLLSRLETTLRLSVIAAMFGDGAAIGWLTSLLRYETFAHGRHGQQSRPENEWLFTDNELDRITELMLSRYRAMSAKDFFACPNPMSLLFAWQQAGDKEGPRRLVEASIVSDGGLVETLERLVSKVVSSDRGQFNVLKNSNLSPFLDFKDATQRIYALREHPDLGERAIHLTAVINDSTNY